MLGRVVREDSFTAVFNERRELAAIVTFIQQKANLGGNYMADIETPLLDELMKGPWPSFVKEFKGLFDKKPIVKAFLAQLERSYQDKISHWKHGGIVGVMGYGGGVIGRYSDLAEEIPDVAHFHTMRVNQPAGWFYTSEALRTIADIWEKHGSGITNMHGSTGDIIFLGTRTENLEPCFADLTKAGFDLGGSGSAVRTPSCCNGMARCEWACYDTMGFTYDLTQAFQDELHRPAFPYKFKFKMSEQWTAPHMLRQQARAILVLWGSVFSPLK